ncbi:Hcp family type VI secretion system effector [Vibrio viridaestus]|uniref:Hcp family type VI secretion system effector n=1 Tax=Vibrio viridaestus TaxID=2487322 RepID=A0A3N9TD88_9VIBR|nr:Hcp family type VI secretion system effector [Vibrio viridaestus]RQW62157.1 Hcp family type VI secretion system effector [Vibrio viridaestus]
MAHVAYLSITGKTQGLISRGCNTQDSLGSKFQSNHTDEITVLSCHHSMSKFGGGHRKSHNPLVITKNIDKSTPLLSTAFSKGEKLSCKLSFYRNNEQGFNEHFYSIELVDAVVVGSEFSLPHTINSHGDEMHEIISLSYNQIIWTHKISGTEGFDSWENGGWGG